MQRVRLQVDVDVSCRVLEDVRRALSESSMLIPPPCALLTLLGPRSSRSLSSSSPSSSLPCAPRPTHLAQQHACCFARTHPSTRLATPTSATMQRCRTTRANQTARICTYTHNPNNLASLLTGKRFGCNPQAFAFELVLLQLLLTQSKARCCSARFLLCVQSNLQPRSKESIVLNERTNEA